ncbi:MAG TPA: CBS domain-containing protein [Longimicrobiaceae bacterium]
MSTQSPQAVRDIMQTPVLTIPPGATIRELVHLLVEHSITGVPVVDGRRRIVGVVSATDVLRFSEHEAEIPAGQLAWAPAALREEAEREGELLAAFTDPDLGSVPEAGLDACAVRDIMTSTAFTVSPADSVADVAEVLLRGRIHRALVVEKGELLGIVTPFDVLRAVFDPAETDR